MVQKTIIIGITGGIAAVKVPELIKKLVNQGIQVIPVMSESAKRIIDIKEIEEASKNTVYHELFPNNYSTKAILSTRTIDHITIAKQADLIVIVPATANVLAKLAHGLADDVLTTTVLASRCPIIVCPSMNTTMWNHPAVQKNIEQLTQWGYQTIEPDSGMLACGDEGKGRLPSVEMLTSYIQKQLVKKTLLAGKRILITSGGTQESIDDVRVITNKSSGKMGAALADACIRYGATVTFLSAKQSVKPKNMVDTYEFESADDVEVLLKKFSPHHDVLFHTAAISDFSIVKTGGKISSNVDITLNLKVREKLYAKVKQWNPSISLITFKAEASMTEERWFTYLKEIIDKTQVDAIIGNPIDKTGQGFGSDMNEAYIVSKDNKPHHIPRTSKITMAQEIIDWLFVEEL